ncbi:hypothetical protein MAC_06079 [Metarhizium acridum CQMa 102]|uniref:Uncharacterized protein n=1 Tax=Metarhizium acridum (strain CQMa 102) TaxID=655827 RepID=E9E881_METAQ|nr:uncharacterized protein MAC_06079 [Metarhizium acridum CQMa 102]EFY87831.1 hypothetical protein MAC_06079 [Metarhizium acridum CQMa 102]
MTTIASVKVQNASTTTFAVTDGANSHTLPAATPGQPGVLDLNIQIATYTIKNGSLVAGSITIHSDATVTIAPGNGGLHSPISVVTELSPA